MSKGLFDVKHGRLIAFAIVTDDDYAAILFQPRLVIILHFFIWCCATSIIVRDVSQHITTHNT